MEVELYDKKGKAAGRVDLPEAIFGVKSAPGFLHEAVTAFLANQRSGTACAKTRAEVSGGSRKPWRQKHTGRSRQGSIRSPLWRKGGVVFGPRPRSYRQAFSRKKALRALGQALSAKREQGAVQLVESFDVEAPKTREVAQVLKVLQAPKDTLVVLDKFPPSLKLAARNVAGLRLGLAADLHPYEVLDCRRLILTRPGLEVLVGRYANV